MKTRIISGVVGVVLLVGLMFLMNTPVFSIAVALLALIAVHEITGVAKVENKIIRALSCIFAAATPLVIDYDLLNRFNIPFSSVLIVYTLAILILMLAQYEKTKFEHVAISFFASITVPFSFSVLVMLRDFHETATAYTSAHSLFFIIFALCCAWLTDTFAYFVGSKFGKHKMSPKISPKKSVEGAIGGVVGAAILNTVLVIIFNQFVFESNPVSVWFVIPVSIALSVISMLGDLSASVIKRNYGAKDFGKIMPGHGGVMDRFDSCLFTLPTLYFILSFLK
ncbi:MAG: hypothetical protein E7544_08025 [Ruminococcaceae bacterium]|nr:hypothetical protein [Oscillospiraceae bacterium]